MNTRPIFIFCFALLLTLHSYAAKFCSKSGKNAGSAARTTVADPGENDYDVKYLKFNLHLTDTSTYVSGDVSTTAVVTTTSLTKYVFELDPTMNIDSAKVNGAVLPVVTGGFVRSVFLPTPLSSGTFFTAQIFYHGTPPTSSGSFFNGMTLGTTSAGTKVLFTVSDPYVAKNWWPSKQSITDKIDSVDMVVTVPRDVVDGSNGILVNVDTSSSPGYNKFHWQTHYLIDYYLISVAVARYAQYKSYWHFTGSTDSVLIHNFFIDTATFNPAYKANFDSIGMFLDYFSSLYGRYPFWREKYGVCYTTLPGGMEHQTMTTIGTPTTDVIAHELCHQWFGDHVTYSTWGDVWLSEGFATFSEQLFLEHFWGPAAGLARRQAYLGITLGNPCGEVYVTDTTSSTTLFESSTVYAKAQGVVTMLRYLAPTDSIFFQVLRNYQNTYAFGNASTADLKAIAESLYGFSLDTFFNQWIYGKGYPKYKVSWDQVGSSVIIKLIQQTSCPASTPHFSTPLELQLHATSADTIVKVYNSLDTQIFILDWAPEMTSVILNPDVWTICTKIGNIKQDTTLRAALNIKSAFSEDVKIFPNPSKNSWVVEHLPLDTGLTLSDMNGRILWKGKSNSYGIALIPGNNLPAGNYLLKLNNNNQFSGSVKLVHW